jgi:hypothetical protein
MRTQTTDPDCASPPPWARLSLDQQKEFISSIGGRVAAANYILSRGHSQSYARNKGIRETHIQGRALDEDRDDLSWGAIREAKPKTGARALDQYQWTAILYFYPLDKDNRDVLIGSSQGKTSQKISEEVGLSEKQIRNIQDQLLVWARLHTSAASLAGHLDDPTPEDKIRRRPASRAGRKRKTSPGGRLATRILILAPCVPVPPKAPRHVTIRRPRRIVVADPRQLDFGWGMGIAA